MILEIDMGNSRLKWRLRSGVARLASGHQLAGADFDGLRAPIAACPGKLSRVLVGSVRTKEEESLLTSWVQVNLGIDPEFARANSSCGLVRNGYANPQQLGVDRWLSILAGYHLVKSTCVLVSAGTALTVDLVAYDGRHLGGYIAPGINRFIDALNQSTALINLNSGEWDLGLAPGENTAMAVGHACAAMIRGIIDNALAQINMVKEREKICLLVTGGDAGHIQKLYPWADYREELVLDGLSYAFGLQPIQTTVK